jgi:hypothetical protein
MAQTTPTDAVRDPQARALLERKLRELAQQIAPAIQAQPPAREVQPPSWEALERDYLDGKMTARQFQVMLQRYKAFYVKSAPPPAPLPTPNSPPEVVSAKAAQPATNSAPVAPQLSTLNSQLSTNSNSQLSTNIVPPGLPVPPAPVVTSTKLPDAPAGPAAAGATSETNNSPAVSVSRPILDVDEDPEVKAVQTKIDELLRLKEARDNAAKLNLILATNTPAAQQSKRQRLNELIRLHVNGKLTEAEYNAKRAAIIAEPAK